MTDETPLGIPAPTTFDALTPISEDEAPIADIDLDLTPEQALEQHINEIKAMPLSDLVDQLPVIRAGNARIATAIQRGGAQLDPLGVIMKRLESIVMMMDPLVQLQINFAFETSMNAALIDAERDIRIASLTKGLDVPPSGGNGRGPRRR